MRKILLDTNAYTRLFLNDESVLEELSKADTIYMSTIVLGELLAGFKGGNKERINNNLLEEFLAKPQVETILVSKETAQIFGEIKYKLVRSGNPLPINDVWIAACAIEMGAVIITYDKHFLKIKEARVWANLPLFSLERN